MDKSHYDSLLPYEQQSYWTRFKCWMIGTANERARDATSKLEELKVLDDKMLKTQQILWNLEKDPKWAKAGQGVALMKEGLGLLLVEDQKRFDKIQDELEKM